MTLLPSCCNRAASSSRIRVAGVAGLCVAPALLCAPGRPAADSAPDWLRALAREKLPNYPDNPIAVQLLDEYQTTVMEGGEIDTRHRVAYKLLRPEARQEYG